MKNLLHSKSTVIVVVIVVILGLVYFYYNGTKAPSSSSDLVASQGTDRGIGSTELSLLGQIQSLKIDPSLFQDPVWNGLQDYTKGVPAEPVGRPNPFEPYPGETVAIPAATGAGAAAH